MASISHFWLRKTGRVLLLFLTVAGSCYYLFHLGYSDYLKKFDQLEGSYDIVNLGNSHGASFDYTSHKINGKGFNKASNTFYYDWQNYKYIKPYIKPGGTIILPVSYFAFGTDENRTDKGLKNSFVHDFYFYLPKESIYDYSHRRKFSIIIHRIKTNFSNNIGQLFGGKNVYKVDWRTDQTKKELDIHAIGKVQKHRQHAIYASPEKNVTLLSRIIEDAAKSGFEVILVTVPFYEAYANGFEPDWLEEHFYQYLNPVKEKYQVPHLDYSNDLRFSTDPSFFHNSDHLNLKGQTHFSRVFFKELGTL